MVKPKSLAAFIDSPNYSSGGAISPTVAEHEAKSRQIGSQDTKNTSRERSGVETMAHERGDSLKRQKLEEDAKNKQRLSFGGRMKAVQLFPELS